MAPDLSVRRTRTAAPLNGRRWPIRSRWRRNCRRQASLTLAPALPAPGSAQIRRRPCVPLLSRISPIDRRGRCRRRRCRNRRRRTRRSPARNLREVLQVAGNGVDANAPVSALPSSRRRARICDAATVCRSRSPRNRRSTASAYRSALHRRTSQADLNSRAHGRAVVVENLSPRCRHCSARPGPRRR